MCPTSFPVSMYRYQGMSTDLGCVLLEILSSMTSLELIGQG